MNAPTPALVAPRPERLRLVGQRRQILAIMHQRLMFGMLVYAGIIGLIAIRILYLAAFGDHAGRKEGLTSLIPDRGDIVDRDGEPLARTIDAWTIAVHPTRILGDKLELARRLAELMPEHSEAQYFALLRSGKPFFYLRRRASPGLVEAVNALGEPGLAIEREPDRLYPQTSLAAHVLGYTDIDGHGVAGMERAFDAYLSDPATRGTPLTLSVDSRVQQALEHELSDAMTTFSAIGAAGVVMDVHTGEVLALTSLPEVNPNAPGAATPDARFNRATQGVYELGSTFKPFTRRDGDGQRHDQKLRPAILLPERASRLRPPGPRHAPVRAGLHGGRDHGGKLQHRHRADRRSARHQAAEILARQNGLHGPGPDRAQGARPGADPGRTLGPVRDHDRRFRPGHCGRSASTGDGLCDLVQRRRLSPADFLKIGAGHRLPPGRRVFTEDTSYRMRALLRLVVMKGTGRKADAPGYRVGGKTGTAQKLINGHYSQTINITSFAGVFPMDDPRYVIVVMLDEPKATPETFGFTTAGWNVAPVVSRTIGRIAPMLGVEPNMSREPDMSQVLPFVHDTKE